LFFAVITLFIVVVSLFVYNSFSSPRVVGYDNFKIGSFDIDSISGEVELLVENPNGMSLNCKDVTIELNHEGNLLAVGTQKNTVTLNSSASTPLPLAFRIELAAIPAGIRDLISRDSVTLSGFFSGKFTWLGIRVREPITLQLSGRYLAELILGNSSFSTGCIDIRDWEIKELTPAHSLLGLKIVIDNKFPFSLTIENLSFGLFSDPSFTRNLAQWKGSDKLAIRESSRTEENAEIKINNLDMALTGISKIITGNTDYYLKGSGLLEVGGYKKEIPFSQKIELDILNRTVKAEKN
jgi:LEA14-like dessication related protein